MNVRSALFNGLMGAAVAAVPVQFLIDPSVENVACACIVLTSAFVVLLYLRVSTALMLHPLSSFALLGFCVSSQLGALLVQTAAWTALRSSLYDPLFTFGTLAFYQLIAVAMHVVYRFFSVRRAGDVHVVRNVLGWFGLYKTPSVGALWCMGVIGLPTFVVWNYEGTLAKIVSAFTFLTWAPFLIPFYSREAGEAYCNRKLNALLLTAYTLVIAVFGIALNARGVIFVGAATVGLLYLLAGLRSEAELTVVTVRRLAIYAVILGILSIPLSDLATAMVIARGGRGKMPAAVMVKTTLRIWRHPSLLAAYRAQEAQASRYSAYDEHYIANPMLGRLVETKFYDNSFHFARALKTDEARARLRDVSLKFIWVGLPQPVLKMLGIRLDKDEFNYSMGDYLAYLARGVPLAGHKTGNMFAQGIALFGPLFPCFYALMCFAFFAVMDLLTVRSASGPSSICALGMLQIWSFFMGGITFESLHKALTSFARFFPQMLVFYLGVFAFARAFGAGRQADAARHAVMLQRSF